MNQLLVGTHADVREVFASVRESNVLLLFFIDIMHRHNCTNGIEYVVVSHKLCASGYVLVETQYETGLKSRQILIHVLKML